MQISKAIRRARKAAGLTQLQLARSIGVVPSTVAGWELGTHAFRMQRLSQLAQALGLSVAELLA